MTTKTNLPLIDIKGSSVGEVAAPVALFGIEPNETVLHFVCEGQRFRYWKKTAATKTRSAVRGGGKKARNQKGTGGARQGGNRAPHWVGGGIAFGPSAIKRDFKINKKVRQIALASVLSDRYSGGKFEF
jgi:large subunit ribosomal protein L4